MICRSAFRNIVAEKFPVLREIITAQVSFIALIFRDIRDAIAWEKQLKGWRRSKKNALVQRDNPRWEDLAADWF